jgi:hypothetical protein
MPAEVPSTTGVPAPRLNRHFTALFATFLFSVCLVSRLPFRSSTLYHIDGVHLALALHQFDVSNHQPQAPGYIIFVGIGRLINSVLHDDNLTLTTMAVLFSAFSAVFVFLLALRTFGDRRTAVFCSCLWVTNPILWFWGEVAETYTAAAFTSTATAFFVLSFWKRPCKRSAILAAAVFAVGGGIRPDQVALLAPLWLLPFWRSRSCRRFFFLAAGVFILGYLAWFVPLVELCGGYKHYSELVHQQFREGTVSSSILSGATILEQSRNLAKLASAIIVGLLPFWALVPLLALRGRSPKAEPFAGREQTLFLAVWALPFLLFFVLILFAKTGYILACLAPLILLLARWTTSRLTSLPKGVFGFAGALLISLLINGCFFFGVPRLPEGPTVNASSATRRLLFRALNDTILDPVYDGIRRTAAIRNTYFRQISELLPKKPAALIFISSSTVPYLDRQVLMYYFPNDMVYGIEGFRTPVLAPSKPSPLDLVIGFQRHLVFAPPVSGSLSICLHDEKRALLLVPLFSPELDRIQAALGGTRDVTPHADDPGLLVLKMFLIEPGKSLPLELVSAGRSIMIRQCDHSQPSR